LTDGYQHIRLQAVYFDELQVYLHAKTIVYSRQHKPCEPTCFVSLPEPLGTE
jgi:hypothetical protein